MLSAGNAKTQNKFYQALTKNNLLKAPLSENNAIYAQLSKLRQKSPKNSVLSHPFLVQQNRLHRCWKNATDALRMSIILWRPYLGKALRIPLALLCRSLLHDLPQLFPSL